MAKRSLTLFLILAMVMTLLVPQVLAGTENAEEGDGIDITEEPSFMYGDLDGDLEVTSLDYAILKNHILYKERILNMIPEVFKAGDVNGDGVINSSDATLLKRYILEIIDEFPAENKEEDPAKLKFLTTKTS